MTVDSYSFGRTLNAVAKTIADAMDRRTQVEQNKADAMGRLTDAIDKHVGDLVFQMDVSRD